MGNHMAFLPCHVIFYALVLGNREIWFHLRI